MSRLTVKLLGGFEVEGDGGQPLAVRTRKAQALLAYLALTPGQAHPRDKLAALLWPDTASGPARQGLRQSLFLLRQVLDSGELTRIVMTGDAVTLPAEAVQTDVAAFERAIAEGTPAALEHAVGLYRGDLLAGLGVTAPPFEDWLMGERERLRELALEALARLLTTQRAAGETAAAVQSARRLLALDPLQETVHRALMRLYVQAGRRDAALRQYQDCVEVLRRELDAEPEAETKELYQEILRQRPARPATAPPVLAHAETARPLIGRERELATIETWLAGAWAGASGVAAIVGEAGIGKTRLLAELTAGAGRRGGSVLLANAHESEQVLPFGPWVSALRQDAALGDPEVVRDLGASWLGELARLFPEIREASQPVSPDPTDPLSLFDALTRLIRHVALRRPVLVALEDLHWADDMSLRFLGFLGRRLRDAPLLVVFTAREEELGEGAMLARVLHELDTTGRLQRLTLPPLPPEATAALVRQLSRAGSRPEEITRLAQQVQEASQGNPFVVVETVRALQDGSLSPAARLPLPDRVRDTIAHRLERLSETGQRLVATAAVIGRPFALPLLACAADVGEHSAAEGVEELVRRRVLRSVGDEFEFGHDRVREVAYARLFPPHRRVLHGLVARALEAVDPGGADAHSTALARHYREAELWDKAVEHLTRAAETAARRYAHGEAIVALEEADRLLRHLPAGDHDRRHLDLVLRQCDILYFLASVAAIRDLLERERGLMERLAAPDLAGRYYFQLARAHSLLGDRERANETAQRAVEAATRSGDDVTRGQAHYVLAREGFWLGEPARGIEHGLEAVRCLESREEPYWLAMALLWTGQSHSIRGDFAPALQAMGWARALAEAIGDSRLQSDFAWRTAQVEATRGEWTTAIQLCEQALATPSSHPFNRANALARLGFAHVEAGEPAAAIPVLEQALDAVTGIAPRGQARGWFLVVLAEALLQSGDLRRARERAEQGLAILEAARYRDGIARAQRALGRIAQAEQAHDEAMTWLTRALDTYASVSARFEVGRTHLALAELLTLRDDREGAARHLQAAHRLFTALQVPRYIARAEAIARTLAISL
jgi:DNA-binding SARP family transcriptional activator